MPLFYAKAPLWVVSVNEHPIDAKPGERELLGEFRDQHEAAEEFGAPTEDGWVREFLWVRRK